MASAKQIIRIESYYDWTGVGQDSHRGKSLAAESIFGGRRVKLCKGNSHEQGPMF